VQPTITDVEGLAGVKQEEPVEWDVHSVSMIPGPRKVGG
jgi:hypothetical protein